MSIKPCVLEDQRIAAKNSLWTARAAEWATVHVGESRTAAELDCDWNTGQRASHQLWNGAACGRHSATPRPPIDTSERCCCEASTRPQQLPAPLVWPPTARAPGARSPGACSCMGSRLGAATNTRLTSISESFLSRRMHGGNITLKYGRWLVDLFRR
jgi:hypothetical protein